MLAKLRAHRPSHTTVVAYLTFFLVVSGGTAVALSGSNTVFSDDITNGQVRNADLGANSVNSAKVADGSLGGSDLRLNSVGSPRILDKSLTSTDIKNFSLGPGILGVNAVSGANTVDDSLKGLDVDESSLGKVPDADKLDGLNSSAFAPSGHNHPHGHPATRSVPIPLASFLDCVNDAGGHLPFVSGNDTKPDIATFNADGLGFVIDFDATTGSPDDGYRICSQLTVPPDYASSPRVRVRLTTGGFDAPHEAVFLGGSVDRVPWGQFAATITQAGTSTIGGSLPLTLTPGQTLGVSLSAGINGAGTMNNGFQINSVEFQYTATG